MALHVHRSNRLERLVDVLADILRDAPLPNPTTPECIGVQGRGMERWLAMELARRLGVWANSSFPFPRKIVTLGTPTSVQESAEAYEPEALTWRIARILAGQNSARGYDEVAAYLHGAETDDPAAADHSTERLLGLSARIASVFDRYLVYRPEMIAAWGNGADPDDWQAILWRQLETEIGATHVVAQALGASSRQALAELPPRISLFGVNALPPFYLEAFNTLAHATEVHLFVLSPSQEFWGHIRSRREIARALRKRLPNAPGDGGSWPR